MIDVLMPATGKPFLDLIFLGLPHIPEPGEEVFADDLVIVPGGMLTSAFTLHRLGLSVLFEATLGRDPASSFLLQAMEQEGLSREAVTLDDNVKAHVTVAYNQQNDRSFLSYSTKTPRPDVSLVQRHQPRAVLMAGLRPCDEMEEILREAKKFGALRIADSQAHDWTLRDQPLQTAISLLDVLLCNEREARLMTEIDDIEQAAAALAAIVPVIGLKRGGDGAKVYSSSGEFSLPAIPVETIDSTGCGDNFTGAFTAALLEGCLINECLAWGNAAGSMAVEAPGGTSRKYTRDELLARVHQHYGELEGPDPLRMVTLSTDDE